MQDLSLNKIDEITDMQLPQLDYLNIAGNELLILPSLKGFPRLRELDFSRNKVEITNHLINQPIDLFNYKNSLGWRSPVFRIHGWSF